MKVELHILQNFPPSNLNRDDTGSPKDCEFGGVRRGRISSQCRKRSIRRSPIFRDTLGANIAIRTKQSDQPIAKYLVDKYGYDEQEAHELTRALVTRMLGWDESKGRSSVLFYAGIDEFERLADLLNSNVDALRAALRAKGGLDDKADKKEREAVDKVVKSAFDAVKSEFTKETQDHVRAVDIALFGRMLAEAPGMNIDAACQVSHSITTNKADQEFDYFTAVDDLNPKEETGAGMIGTTGYNSGCFYSYAMIDVDQLARNLSGDRALAIEGVRAFLTSALQSIPTGKQNTFAAQTPPSLFLAVVRDDGTMPWSLVNAFVKPVSGPRRDDDPSLVEASVAALDDHWASLADMYGSEGTRCFVKVARGAGTIKHLADAQVPTAHAVIEGVAGALENWSEQVPA